MHGNRILTVHCVMVALSFAGSAPLLAQGNPSEVITLNRLPISDASQPEPPPADSSRDAPPASEGPHPLLPALKIAYRSHEFLTTKVKDYSCRVVKQERINGQLQPVTYIDAKARHRWQAGDRLVHPRALYLKFLTPESVTGREVLWVEGHNDGKMIVRRGGRRFHYITVELDPTSETAMQDSDYAIMDMGLIGMVRQLIDVGLEDMKYGECDVEFFHDVKIDGRPCICIQVTHPQRRSQFKFHIARIYVDDENPVPLRYEAYDWPESDDEAPPLLEQFTFQHLRLNVGLSDAEFRRDYPDYGFRE